MKKLNSRVSLKRTEILLSNILIDFEFVAEICEDSDTTLLSLPVDFKLESILVIGDKITQSFFVRSSSLDTRYFQLMVSQLF